MPAMAEPASRRTILKAGAAGAITLLFDLHALPRAARAEALTGAGSLATAPRLASWIRIDAAGEVTVFTGKAELGQGILTALVQIAADELDVDPARIRLISADTASTPNELYTAGSMSVSESGMAIRHAAAELRHHLLRAAAAEVGVDTNALRVADGVIAGGGRSITYGAIAARLPRTLEATGRVAPKPPAARRIAGRSMARVDIPAKVLAEGRFLHDLRLDGMLHGRIVRPPAQDSRLVTVDEAAVAALPGMVRVVRDGSFLGVLAEREEQAIAAAEALRRTARWSAGRALPDPGQMADLVRHHPAAESAVISESRAPAVAGRRITARYVRPYQAHASIGPSLALARFDAQGLTVWSHTQGVFPLRGALAEALGLDASRVHVIHREGAGCYGHNGADDVALDAALLARAVPGRPVRVQWMRDDEFQREPYGSAMVMEAAATLDGAGRIVDWDYGVWGFPHTARPGGRAGNLLSARLLARPFPPGPAVRLPQPKGGLDRNAIPLYRLPRHRVVKYFIADSPLRVSALRGLGAYANVYAIESFMDELAQAAGADPVAFRLAHLEDARARAVIKAAAEMAEWSAVRATPDTGRGIAFARYKNMGGYLAVVAQVAVDRTSGRIRVLRADAAVDCGEVINPDGLTNQVEGGIIQSTSWTLLEEVAFAPEGILSEDWATYPILAFPDVPAVAVRLLDRPGEAPLGAGEVAQGPMAAAIANAVHDAVGIRLRELPFLPDRVHAAIAGETG